MSKVTIVIPVYNVESYLDGCLQSVLAQTYTDYDVLLIDDGSVDRSGALCDEFAQTYSHVKVIHQANQGLGGARNTGIEHAIGEYLLFLDSDDSIHPQLLERCVGYAERYDCDMVLFDAVAVYSDGSRGAVYTCPAKAGQPLRGDELCGLVSFSGACNRLFRRTLFIQNDVRFPKHVWYEDLRTVSKLVPAVKVAYYDAQVPLYFYLQRSGSIMHTPDLARIVEERLAAVGEIIEYYEQRELYDVYRDELEFLWLFHGYFLPVREMQLMSSKFPKYADQLRCKLLENFPNAAENRYIVEQLNGKERFLLTCAIRRRYVTIKIFSFMNKLLKRIKHVEQI